MQDLLSQHEREIKTNNFVDPKVKPATAGFGVRKYSNDKTSKSKIGADLISNILTEHSSGKLSSGQRKLSQQTEQPQEEIVSANFAPHPPAQPEPPQPIKPS